MSIKWVTIEKAAEILGLTKQAIHARIKRAQWREGREHVKQGGRRFINIEAVYTWIEQAKTA